MARKITKKSETKSLKAAEAVEAAPQAEVQVVVPTPEAPKSFLSGPVVDTGRKYFSKKDFNLLELSQLRVSSIEKEIQLKQIGLEKFVQEAQVKVREMNEEIQKIKKSHGERIEELKKVYLEIEKIYQVSMRQMSYNEMTGEIFEHKQ
jgi:hypothetical protein